MLGCVRSERDFGALDCQKLSPTRKVGKNNTVDTQAIPLNFMALITFLFWLGADRFLYVLCFPGVDGPEDLEELNADSRAYYVPKREL